MKCMSQSMIPRLIYRILNSFETRLQSPDSPRLNHIKHEHQQFQKAANTRMPVSVCRKTKMAGITADKRSQLDGRIHIDVYFNP